MRIVRAAVFAVAAVVLSACFDLDQKFALGRDGSGSYRLAVTVDGVLKKTKDGDGDLLKPNKAVVTTEIKDGKTVKTARVDFRDLSELALEKEQVSLTVLSHSWFGFGPTHARFRHMFLAAKRAGGAKPDGPGAAIVSSALKGHTYSFSVTLPGSIDRIAPVKVNGVEVKPQVSGDFYNGHTVSWRMPLDALMGADTGPVFEVDFSAFGSFKDRATKKG